MPLNTALNHRQLEVLRWISDGCPDGRWTDFTFKTTAAALASRRLVSVSKRGGVWSAALLPAGDHYLTRGRYPESHWAKPGRAQPMIVDTPLRPATPALRVMSGDQSRFGGISASRRAQRPQPSRPPTSRLLSPAALHLALSAGDRQAVQRFPDRSRPAGTFHSRYIAAQSNSSELTSIRYGTFAQGVRGLEAAHLRVPPQALCRRRSR